MPNGLAFPDTSPQLCQEASQAVILDYKGRELIQGETGLVSLAFVPLRLLCVVQVVGHGDRLALDAEEPQGAGRHHEPVGIGGLPDLGASPLASRGLIAPQPVEKAVRLERAQCPHHGIAGAPQPVHEERHGGL